MTENPGVIDDKNNNNKAETEEPHEDILATRALQLFKIFVAIGTVSHLIYAGLFWFVMVVIAVVTGYLFFKDRSTHPIGEALDPLMFAFGVVCLIAVGAGGVLSVIIKHLVVFVWNLI